MSDTLSEDEITLIQDGDIILRHGNGLVSDLIVKSLHEEFDISHCAIITKKNNDFVVIHSVSQSLSDYDGVQSQSLKSFVKSSHKICDCYCYNHDDQKVAHIILRRPSVYHSMMLP